MRPLNRSAQDVLESLIAGLPSEQVGAAHRFDATPDIYMAVSVERIGPRQYSVAHYGEQNGDLMRDPEMCFWHAPDGRFYPTYFRNDYVGSERECVWFDEHGQPKAEKRREQADQAVFAATWMHNIAHQQADALRPEVAQ
jgi:hypothetical protein